MFGIRNLSKLKQYLTKSNSTVTVSLHTLSNRFIISHVKDTQTTCNAYRFFMCSAVKHTGKSSSTSNQTPNIGEYDTLTEYHAYDMIHKLSENDRASLLKALNKYNSDRIKSKFQGNFLVCLIWYINYAECLKILSFISFCYVDVNMLHGYIVKMFIK